MRESWFAREMRLEGQIDRLRFDLLKVMGSRYGKEVAAELTPDVNAVDSLAPLERLFDQALSGVGLDEFRSSLEMVVIAGGDSSSESVARGTNNLCRPPSS
jgi:hypothetical protein